MIERARSVLKCVLNPASTPSSNQKIAEMWKQHPDFIYPCYGVDPISELKHGRENIMEWIAQREEVRAIGEIGLDYHWSRDKDTQKKNFIAWLEFASEIGKPVVIHLRKSLDDGFDILEKHAGSSVVIHCFSGNQTHLKKAVDNGFYVSFATNALLFKNKYLPLIKKCPLEHMLLETDSPYLWKGRNEPANVSKLYEFVSEIKGESFIELERVIDNNFHRVFGRA
jgi:TatD DNase family protein